MNPGKLNAEEGIKIFHEKLDSLFKMDTNQAALIAYGNFEKYTRQYDHC